MFVRRVSPQVKAGGTHRFHDSAAVESKHRESLKSHGTKIRVRTDTQTEADLLSVTQEELVYDAVENLLGATTTAVDTATDSSATEDATIEVATEVAYVVLDKVVTTNRLVYGSIRDHLVHKEILLSWGEVVGMFVHCFPSVRQHLRNSETTWHIAQHCTYERDDKRYQYWGTDTAYRYSSRHGCRRRRDMVRVGLQGEHLAEMVAFVRVTLPVDPTSREDAPAPRQVVGALVRWLTPHARAIIHDGSPTCPGPLCYTHNLWEWHKTTRRRDAISGYRYGRLPQQQKAWLQPESKRQSQLFASYDVVELETCGKYANVTPDFSTDGFLESVSWP